MTWWQTFFDKDYRRLWSSLHPEETCRADAENLVQRMGLSPGDRVLDAPCGYGRISLPLANLGMQVLGVDYSSDLIEEAKRSAAESNPIGSVQFQRSDLRDWHPEAPLDAAVHLFSSLGYSSEDDDLRVLRSIANALHPGAPFFLETVHRDAIVTRRALGQTTGVRGPNGLTLREKNTFNPLSGSMESTWTWNSPTESGSKHSRIRIYSVTELLSLLQRAGFVKSTAFCGLGIERFSEETLGERVGILCYKE